MFNVKDAIVVFGNVEKEDEEKTARIFSSFYVHQDCARI